MKLQEEIKRIKSIMGILNEQRWLDDIINSAKNLDASKNIPDFKSILTSIGKSFDDFLFIGNDIFKKLEIESLITKSEFTAFRSQWDKTIKDLILRNVGIKDIPNIDLIDFVKGKELSGENLKKIDTDDLEYLVSLQVLNRHVVYKIDEIENGFNKLFAEKLNEYIRINGKESYDQLKNDLISGKKTSEEVWDSIKNPTKINVTSDLTQLLKSYQIPISEWGKGYAKTIGHLQKEIDSKECNLIVEGGTLIREIEFVMCEIIHVENNKIYKLIEEKQIFTDGRTRTRNKESSMSEKMKIGEDPLQSLIRGVEEELGLLLDQTQIQKQKNIYENEMSNSFPGLMTRYNGHNFSCQLTKEQFNPNGYIETQSDKITYFKWKLIE